MFFRRFEPRAAAPAINRLHFRRTLAEQKQIWYEIRHDGCVPRFGHRVDRSANYRPGFRLTVGSAEDRDCRALVAINPWMPLS